jgi:hypothetical protein
MCDRCVELDKKRHPKHLDIALIADDEPMRRVKQQDAPHHVADGDVEPVMLQRQLSKRRLTCRRRGPANI